jgi:hypothetical protein
MSCMKPMVRTKGGGEVVGEGGGVGGGVGGGRIVPAAATQLNNALLTRPESVGRGLRCSSKDARRSEPLLLSTVQKGGLYKPLSKYRWGLVSTRRTKKWLGGKCL